MVEVQRPVEAVDTLESSSGYGRESRNEHIFSSSSAPDDSTKLKCELARS